RARANVVAAPLSGLAADARFGTFSVPQDQAFDLLLVEHAEQVTEAEFTALAGRCRRWVLIAESMPGPRVLAASIGDTTEASRDGPKPERRKVKPAAPSFFQSLWSRLHCAPSRLPYAWSRESDARLCCQLRALSREQRRWIETERVADYPDVELRIVAPP